MKTERHIYDHSCKQLFYTNLGKIHTTYIDKLVMCGVGAIDADIETIKMTRMFNTMKYLKHVMGGMLKIKPSIQLLLVDDNNETEIECLVTVLNNNDDVSGVYMTQNVNNYPNRGQCLYQFWQFKDNFDVDIINNIYNDDT